MQSEGLSQISLTDPDAMLMKTKNTFCVAHNVQTAVESDTHMIADFIVNVHPIDHGMLNPTMSAIKENSDTDSILEVTAYKGCQEKFDMMECLENGIIPNVILPEGKDVYSLETPYEEAEISADDLASKTPEDLRKCLRSGNIPDAYKDVLSGAEMVEITEISCF